MNTRPLINELKAEILKLRAAVAALEGMDGSRRGRVQVIKPKRRMSAAARRKIAAAQRARWARWRKAA